MMNTHNAKRYSTANRYIISKKKFYHILPIFNGIRIGSGVNHSDFFSASTEIQHQPVVFPPTDELKCSDNIVVKLTNVKFTEVKNIEK